MKKTRAAEVVGSGETMVAPPLKRPKKEKSEPASSSSEEDDDDNLPVIPPVICKSEPHDTTNAIPIILDVQDLAQKEVFSLGDYEDFIIICYSKRKLLAYDQPDPRSYGPCYVEGERVAGWYLEVAEFAFDWYKKNCPGSSKKQWIQEKTKMNVHMTFCYVSFIVADEDTKEETRIQSMLLAPPLSEWQIGMVRDATHEQVLAIIKLKQEPTGAIANNFHNAMKFIGKKVLVMT